jgi:hypothetical protein
MFEGSVTNLKQVRGPVERITEGAVVRLDYKLLNGRKASRSLLWEQTHSIPRVYFEARRTGNYPNMGSANSESIFFCRSKPCIPTFARNCSLPKQIPLGGASPKSKAG